MHGADDGCAGFSQRLPQGSHVPLSSTLQTIGKESGQNRMNNFATVGLATLSDSLTTLFPQGAVCAQLIGRGDPQSLLPAEAQFLGRAVASRREEFAAGRACVRRALRELGILDLPVGVAEDRRPVWPQAITGSITHTKGFAAAVVARSSALRSLGIDTEKSGSVKPELWPRICGPESGWLGSLPEAERRAAATLIFCIKEAFYKCQYTITGQFLGFDAARVLINGWGETAGGFTVHAVEAMELTRHVSLPLVGRFLLQNDFVTAGAAVPQ
jgi:4'-phosphopantetheinyl transferase EntD